MIKLIDIVREVKIRKPIFNSFKYCWIDSHEDYHTLNLASKQSYEKYINDMAEAEGITVEEVMDMEWMRYKEDIPDNRIIHISWNDEGPYVLGFDDFHDFLKDIIIGFWGEESLIEKLNKKGLNGEKIWEDFYTKDNKKLDDEIWKELKIWIDNSEADGGSGSAVLLIIDGKIVAGNNYYII